MGVFNILDNTRGALNKRRKHGRIIEELTGLEQRGKSLVGATNAAREAAEQQFGAVQQEVIASLRRLNASLVNLPEEIAAGGPNPALDVIGEMRNGDHPGASAGSVRANLLASGAKAASGPIAALAAYTAVGTLGTASTGAAIGGLSGVAASNATLAWFGGGALAAGGGGMALGTAVLGGVVALPLAFAGAELANKHFSDKLDGVREALQAYRDNFSRLQQQCDAIGQVAGRVQSKIEILSYCRDRIQRYQTIIDSAGTGSRASSGGISEHRRAILEGCEFSVRQIEDVVARTITYALIDEDQRLSPPLTLTLKEIDPMPFEHSWTI